jgi:hypothetical protein
MDGSIIKTVNGNISASMNAAMVCFQKYTLLITVCISITVFPVMQTHGQIIYTEHFTRLLDRCDLEFQKSERDFYHILPFEKDSYHNYNLVLINDSEEIEIRYIIEPDPPRYGDLFPFQVISKLTSVATNDQDMWLNYRMLSNRDSQRKYSADVASEGSFRPKKSFSKKGLARYVAFYKNDGCMIIVYTIADNKDKLPDPAEQSLRFRTFREEE